MSNEKEAMVDHLRKCAEVFGYALTPLVPVNAVKKWEPRIGELCTFYDYREHTVAAIFTGMQGFKYKSGVLSWLHCEPLNDPMILQFFLHDGGECPYPELSMYIKFHDNTIEEYKRGDNCPFWKHGYGSNRRIIAYAIVSPIEPSP